MWRAFATIIAAPIAFTIIVSIRVATGALILIQDIIILFNIVLTIIAEIIEKTTEKLAEHRHFQQTKPENNVLILFQNTTQQE